MSAAAVAHHTKTAAVSSCRAATRSTKKTVANAKRRSATPRNTATAAPGPLLRFANTVSTAA